MIESVWSLHAILIFVRVAEAKSFIAASRRLGISPSGVSRSVTRLEKKLGVRLMNRTTRSISLTDEGQTFFERCAQIVHELEDAETVITQKQLRPHGRLRVQMPVGFGRRVLVPYLVQFAQLYPELTVDVEFSDRPVDLAKEGLDAVIRMGTLADSSLVVRKLCDTRYVIVASPGYLAHYGTPTTPDDLEDHRCLGYYIPQTNRYREWTFMSTRSGKPIWGNLNMNNGDALLHAAMADGGLAMVATYLAADAVRAGELQVVLREYISVGPPVSVGYLERRQLPSRTRAFVEFLIAQVPQSPLLDAISNP